ncbi:MAG: hypothetical protein K2L17_04230 [Muribaculaceae bacterium]|nr:hypothetical protein [Muribaculaceae bacterium]MDE6787629.1 hypothetical protein [Muribaculaceae bacterium]
MKCTVCNIRFLIFTVLSALWGLGVAYAQDPDPLPLPNDSIVDAELLVRTPIEADLTEEDGHTVVVADDYPYGLNGKKIFNPDPTRAVWMSALFPGLGQIYNRRYWKLPIVVAGFMGLGYGMSWNNTQYQDYSNGYMDLMSDDPNKNSYMNFFPPNTDVESLDKNWLKSVFQTRKNFYRRNRDLCIICMVGVYLIAIVDAYVDAQLAHFDISPDLSLDISPGFSTEPVTRKYSIGLNWAFTF